MGPIHPAPVARERALHYPIPMSTIASDNMVFFGFEHLLDGLRGMQLEDPDERADRAWLEGLRDSGSISTFGRLLLSILHFRAARYEDCLLALEALASDEKYGPIHPVLSAAALSGLGRHDEAIQALLPDSGDIADLTRPPPQNEHYGPSFLVACRANALWRSGQRERALALAEAAAQLPEAPEYRWQELAQYAADLERWPLVLSAIEHVGEMERRRETLLCVALAYQALGQPEQALAHLKIAAQWDKPTRQRLSRDPRFAGLPGLDALVADVVPNFDHLKKRKDIAHLLTSPALAAAGVEWANAALSKARTKEYCGAFRGKHYTRGLIWSPTLWKACDDLAKPLSYVAELPALHRRSMGDENGALFHDKATPGWLWFTPSPHLPSVLWIRLPATEQALLDAMAWFYPAHSARIADLPARRRAWAGDMRQNYVPNPYSGELEAAGVHEIGRFWVSSTVVDMLGWGSAYDEDPWPNVVRMGGGGGLTMSVKMREYGQDLDGSLPRLNHRTTLSRSLLSLEIHPDYVCVWDIRYRPSPFTESVQRFNTITGYSIPDDLPIDVVAAIHGFQYGSPEWIQRLIDDPEYADRLYPLVTMAAAVGYGDLRTAALLRRILRHEDPNVAAAAINAIIRYNLAYLLAEAGLNPYPEDYLRVIAARLDEGIGWPAVQTEPYEDEDYEDDEDDEDDEDEDDEEDE